jgi:hypothetical protein
LLESGQCLQVRSSKEKHTTDLLEHLVHISKNCPVQVPVLVNGKAVLESALFHFEDSILDGIEFALDCWIVFRKI